MSGTKNQKAAKKPESSGWSKAEDELKQAPRDKNEGEGNKSAANVFDRNQSDFARHGDVAGQANAAKSAREGAEREELEEAEEIGKSHSHGEDPALFRKGHGPKDTGAKDTKKRN
jgi:hypothetical protein